MAYVSLIGTFERLRLSENGHRLITEKDEASYIFFNEMVEKDEKSYIFMFNEMFYCYPSGI